jgi:hypothetical protein
VMNIRVPQNGGDFLSSWGPVSFLERLCCMGLVRTVNRRFFY